MMGGWVDGQIDGDEWEMNRPVGEQPCHGPRGRRGGRETLPFLSPHHRPSKLGGRKHPPSCRSLGPERGAEEPAELALTSRLKTSLRWPCRY